MKRLVPTLLAVLFLAGCAVNKPLPVEAVKLAGIKLQPISGYAGHGLKCNTYSSKYNVNYICLGSNEFDFSKMYYGKNHSSEDMNLDDTTVTRESINKIAKQGGFIQMKTPDPDLLAYQSKGKYTVYKIVSGKPYLIIASYTGVDYPAVLTKLDKMVDAFKAYNPDLSSK